MSTAKEVSADAAVADGISRWVKKKKKAQEGLFWMDTLFSGGTASRVFINVHSSVGEKNRIC